MPDSAEVDGRGRRLESRPGDTNFILETNDHSHSPMSLSSHGGGRRSENIWCEGGGEGSSSDSNGGLVYGHVSMMGRRRVMEDAVAVGRISSGEEEVDYSYFGVYDGHGGAEVAETCGKRLRGCLEKQIEKGKDEKEVLIEWEKVMVETFRSMDEEIGELNRDGEARMMVGSTEAAVVLISKEDLVAANCGDSRAVLCRAGVAVPLSRNHHNNKADRPDNEKEKLEGGIIRNWNDWRVSGDGYLTPYPTSSEPEVTVTKGTESDEFVIIATDGLWDVVCDETACETVRNCLYGRLRRKRASEENVASEAAATLAEIAMAKGSRDNISIIVVQLK